jgi:hypothetical protein
VNIYNTRINNINRYWGHPPTRFGEGGFHYANMRGFTAVSGRTLASGVPIHGSPVRVTGRQLANAPMGRVNVTPARGAMLGPNAGRQAAMPPRSGMRPTFNRASGGFNHGPAVAGHKPFAGRVNGASTGAPRMNNAAMEGRGATGPSGSVAQRPGFGGTQMARNIPRPPMSGSMAESRGGFSAGGREGGGFAGNNRGNVGANANNGGFARNNGGFARTPQRSVPRPPAGVGSNGGGAINNGARGNSNMGSPANRPSTNVPRPTGPVRSAGDNSRMSSNQYGGAYNSNASRGGYNSSPSYRGTSAPSYRRTYGGGSASPSYRGTYGGGSVSPSYRGNVGSSPSYRGGSPAYGGGSPRYSSPSYSRSGGSMPSYHGSPSYGGGGGSRASSAPSYHGGGGGGGSHSSAGGGGHSGGHR